MLVYMWVDCQENLLSFHQARKNSSGQLSVSCCFARRSSDSSECTQGYSLLPPGSSRAPPRSPCRRDPRSIGQTGSSRRKAPDTCDRTPACGCSARCMAACGAIIVVEDRRARDVVCDTRWMEILEYVKYDFGHIYPHTHTRNYLSFGAQSLITGQNVIAQRTPFACSPASTRHSSLA